MVSRELVTGALVAVALTTVVGARQQVGAPQEVLRLDDTDPAVVELKQAISTFEGVIERAVLNGGGRLADRARTIVPELELWMEGAPIISAVQVPEVGLVFDVQIPDVSSTSIQLFALLQRNPSLGRPTPTSGGNVAAVPATSAAALMPFDVGREYGEFVRDALVDAMLGYSASLPLEPLERLIIVGRVPQQNALQLPASSRKLVLQILGSDLALLRAGQITRDEAEARIIESRF